MKIQLKKDQQIWFISDTHYDHKNICSATSDWGKSRNVRKFDSLNQMNDELANNINELVQPDDILFHLGDWSFNGFENIAKFRNRLVCENIHLILGNHDHHIERNKDDMQSLFSSVNKYLELEIGIPNGKSEKMTKLHMVLMHFPIASWNNMSRGWWHLHGHVHLPQNKKIGQGKSMDVGCDGNHLRPTSLSYIRAIMKTRPIKPLILPIDHHAE